jgi:dipeptidyl aminopeptidase/acylaminoacyl peptidase
MQRVAPFIAIFSVASCGCCCGAFSEEAPTATLRELRAGFQTRVFYDDTSREPAPEPPPELFDRVRYRAPLGENAAYVSPVREGERRPAIVWIAGGLDWGISEGAWLPASREDDQSARAFRDAGIALMLPSLRGSNDNPGRNECFFGEVEDVIAAATYLATRPDVDPDRIYLGGHSTGGTLAVLVAASTDRFRAVFAFGPVSDPRSYGSSGCLPLGASDQEVAVRVPIHFIDEVSTPTFLIEGSVNSNGPSVRALHAARETAPVQAVLVPGMDHFSVLAPGTEIVAAAILGDTGARAQLRITARMIAER